MNNITFDKGTNAKHKKEDIEWLRIWCEDTNNEHLPRIALVGDSITEGYYPFVRDSLKEVAKVDYLATSYSISSDMYCNTVKNFIKDSDYVVVHYNYGLHGYVVDEQVYERCCREILQQILSSTSVILATTTTVLDESLREEKASWSDKVQARNEKLVSLAREFNLRLDDLCALCGTFDISMRDFDGVHFDEHGYRVLANSVSQSIRKELEIN